MDGYDPTLFRKDACGAWIIRDKYGDSDSIYGWQIDHIELVPMQPGDVPVTYADTTPLEEDFGFKPRTTIR